MKMKLKAWSSLLKTAVDAGTSTALSSASKEQEMTKTKAYRIYGRTNVDRWLAEDLIQISNKKLNRLKLEAVASASNRVTYLPVTER